MVRPAQFDTEQVLQDCMQAFWRRGYNGTSIRDLVEVTGLQPGSLYGTFDNKRSLFLRTLEHYFAGQEAFVQAVLHNDKAPPLQRIYNFFDELLRQSTKDREKKGCLLINTLVETPPDEIEINRRVIRMLNFVEKSLYFVLEEAAADGSLPPQRKPAVLAKVLVNGIFGLRVNSKMRSNRELRQIVTGLLSLLELPG